MTAACMKSKHGLVAGHAYTLLGANKKTDRLIVRNPWSTEKYYGEGSDQDADGIFEVPVSVFKYSFTAFTISYYADWKIASMGRTTMDTAGKSYQSVKWNINNPVAQELFLTLDLVDENQIAAKCEQYN